MKRILRAAALAGLVLAMLAPIAGAASPPSTRRTLSGDRPAPDGATTISDFNGDGYADLAVGVPGEDGPTANDVGGINVIYGSASGLTATDNQFLDQNAISGGGNGADNLFGWALAGGDFNADGYADLAVGTPNKPTGGAIYELHGSATGIDPLSGVRWNQSDVGEFSESDDYFGYSVAAGDVNGDGFDDVAVGATGEDVGAVTDAGSVNVILGSATGLIATGSQFWNQDSPGIRESAASGEGFGAAVTIGDFSGDGFADLAIGVPGEKIGTHDAAGAVNVLPGSAAGLTEVGDQLWHQDVTDINDKVEAGDLFGYALAAGDIDGDGYDDLLSGILLENVGSVLDAGAASAIYGSSTGLDAAGDEFWHQDRTGINNVAETNDEFGAAVTIGDFDGDGFGDAAIGVPLEDLPATDAGAVNVIYGTAAGLDDAGDDFWNQGSTDIRDSPEDFDWLGFAVVAGNYGNGPEEDLVIGVPYESLDAEADGIVNVIYGSPTDLTATGNQRWWQGSADIEDDPENFDAFGFGLAEGVSGSGPSVGSPPGPQWRPMVDS